MKILSITAVLLMLAAVPAQAGLLTVQDEDAAAQCGLTAAHLIINGSESSRLFPDDNSVCAELGDEASNELNVDVLRAQPAARVQVEPILAIATLSLNPND
jgi:hypothetical protein